MLGLLTGQGAAGVPVPDAPMDFAAPPRPPSPNWWMALPPDEARGAPRCTPYALPPGVGEDAAWQALLRVAAAMPRCHLLTAWPGRRQAQWVLRSATMNFPDILVADVAAGVLRLHSRSLLGWSDLGVNQARIGAWIAAMDGALR